MSDIVERLRTPASDDEWMELMAQRIDAADEIKRLRAALSTARADALEEAARVVLEQRCERGTPWDNACLDAASAIRALNKTST